MFRGHVERGKIGKLLNNEQFTQWIEENHYCIALLTVGHYESPSLVQEGNSIFKSQQKNLASTSETWEARAPCPFRYAGLAHVLQRSIL